MRAERGGDEFKHRFRVIIESADDERIDFVRDAAVGEKFLKFFEVRGTILAKIIDDFRRVLAKSLAFLFLAVENTKGVFVIPFAAGRTKFIEFIGEITF